VTAAGVPDSRGDPVDGPAAAAFHREYGDRPGRPLAVVVAAYNEEDGVGAAVSAVPTEVCGLAVDVIVVVDGSSDGTAAAARTAGVMVCDVPVNRGQGAALRLGYRLARDRGATIIATLDADGQFPAAELPLVVAPVAAGDADFATGSRRLGTAHTTDRVRSTGVVFFGALITLLTGTRITDPANGMRAMRSEVTGAVTLAQPQYQASELLIGAIMRGYRVVEVPTTMVQRSAGTSKKGGNLLYGVRYGRVVLGTWWRDRSSRSSRGAAKITSS
jgi:hypothetical protein